MLSLAYKHMKPNLDFSLIDKTEKEDTDYMKMVVSTREPPNIYQQLQLNQHSKDDKISKCEQQSAAEHELQQTTDMNSQQPQEEHKVQSREAKSVNTKVAMRKVMIILSVMVAVNIVMLMLLTAAPILGGIQIQSKFEQVMSAQNLSTNQINDLTVSTNENIAQISMQLKETYYNISRISRELGTTNDTLTSAQNQYESRSHLPYHHTVPYSSQKHKFCTNTHY